MHYMSMIDMRLSPEEMEEEMAERMGQVEPEIPEYPPCLRLHLDEDVLEKLGLLDDMPKAGTYMNVTGYACVVATSYDDRDDACVTLQLEKLECKPVRGEGRRDGKAKTLASKYAEQEEQ
jgi:hypothetical protein